MKIFASIILSLLCACGVAEAQTFVSVTDKQKSYHHDKHDYESISIYWWPNESSADGLPYVEKDGVYNPEYKNYDLPRLLQLSHNLQTSAQQFLSTGQTQYYDAFCKQLDVWFLDRSTRMNPNFNYSQFIPGRDGDVGQAGGIIDAYNFLSILDNIDDINARKSLGWNRNRKFKKWAKAFYQWLLTSPQGLTEQSRKNNHGLAYDVICYRFAMFVGDTDKCRDIQQQFAAKRINSQIQPDGLQPEELRRTRAFKYSCYNLEHMIDFCEILSRQGINYIDGDGCRIKEALLFLYPYLSDRSSFSYQEIGPWSECEQMLRNEIVRIKKLSNDPRIKALK